MIEELKLQDFAEQKVVATENIIKRDLSICGHITTKAQILIGTTEISIEELFSLKAGSVVKMMENIEEPMQLLLDGKTIARGTLVVVDEKFGFEITEIAD